MILGCFEWLDYSPRGPYAAMKILHKGTFSWAVKMHHLLHVLSKILVGEHDCRDKIYYLFGEWPLLL